MSERRIVWVDTAMASVHLLWAYGMQVPPATIRQWAQRDPERIQRLPRGKYRYDLQQVVDYALERATDDPGVTQRDMTGTDGNGRD